MFIKRHVRRKDGKRHVYYSLCESTRISPQRVLQRRLLNLGELNTTQIERWQRSIEVVEENGQAAQKRFFTDREGEVPQAPDVCEVRLSTLWVRKPRQCGDCWLACRLFEELQLDQFFSEHLAEHRGPEDWGNARRSPNQCSSTQGDLFVESGTSITLFPAALVWEAVSERDHGDGDLPARSQPRQVLRPSLMILSISCG